MVMLVASANFVEWLDVLLHDTKPHHSSAPPRGEWTEE